MKKIRLGTIHADYITKDEAVERILELASAGRGGYVVTPNVPHIVKAEKNERLRAAYADAALSLADGKPLLWMSRIAGFPLPEKVSGSDLIRPLLAGAAARGLSAYFLGSAPGVALAAAERLRQEIPGLSIVGVDSPPMGFERDLALEEDAKHKMESAHPDIVLFALGAPKQELLMHRWSSGDVAPVMLGIGASLDFIAGKVKRAPRWMSEAGLEWLFRLAQDPKRLAKRYLVQDMGIIPIFLRLMKTPAEQRVFEND